MAGTKKTAKDLPGKTASVKGGAGSTGTGNGKLATNDNVTLVRG